MKRTKLLAFILVGLMITGCTSNSGYENIQEGGNWVPQEYSKDSETDNVSEEKTYEPENTASSDASADTTSCIEPVEEKDYDDISLYEYEENDEGGITITEYLGEDDKTKTKAVIPAVIDNKPVTVIGEWAFNDCYYLTSIDVPDSVTMINDNAFYMNRSLETIDLSDNLYWIGENAFFMCESITNIELPDSLWYIGRGAFWCCISLVSIDIPDMVTAVPRDCFRECRSLTSVEFPANIEDLGIEAFFNCDSLTSIEIPDRLSDYKYSISDSVFNWCNEDLKIYYQGKTYNPDSFKEYIKSLYN